MSTTTLTIHDETTGGESREAITLQFLTDNFSVRELIRERVYQEVKDYNADQAAVFRGLVRPTDAEEVVNGYKLKKPRMIDWEPQFRSACDSFENGGFLILVDNRQLDSLDEMITVTPSTRVSFLKIVPLVGG